MATEQGDDLYECNLNEESKKKAKDELNERNDADRKLAVQTLRKWVLEQNWLKTPTDFKFLLRYLRVRKFSQLGARETLENYWTNKAKRPDWYKDLDPADPVLQDIFRSTRIYYSPMKYDKSGRRMIYAPFGKLSTEKVNKYGLVNIYRVMILFIEWICSDENVQVNGARWLIDYTDLSLAVVMKFASKPEDQKYINQFLQKSTPVRMKAFYIYNEPSFFDVIYSMFSVFSRQKMLDRIELVGKNMAKVYEKVEMSVLPDEYLPDDYDGPSAGPESQIVEDMLADMMSPKFRDHIREVSSTKYGIDLSKRPLKEEKVSESFRKLNVD